MRVKGGPASRARHKKLVKQVKGMGQTRRSSARLARQAQLKAQAYAYRDRRTRKREFKKLWITRINAAARLEGLSYSQLINLLSKAEIEIDRKILAELAVNQPEAFRAIVAEAKKLK